MKKIVISAFLFASLMACYKDNLISAPAPITKAQNYTSANPYSQNKLHKITPERALSIADASKELFSDNTQNSSKARSAALTFAPVVITKPSRARSAGCIDTLMYIVNYGNNGGFVFVSNDDRDGEILMYAGGGNFAMQDTAGNPGLKLHVEMILAYQEHKLTEIRAAEARGEEYTGSMTREEVMPGDMMPTDVLPMGAAGLPGMLGHTCNVTGSPGMPGAVPRQDICAPATFVSKTWEGDADAIEMAKKKYKNEKCFGVPVVPPVIDFAEGGTPGPLGPGTPCPSPPYCEPPLWNYEGYYFAYGAKMKLYLRTQRDIQGFQIQPLLTTTWDQFAPLKHGSNYAGCGPIAVAQIMVYHKMPKTYGSKALGGTIRTEVDGLRKLRTNTDIANSPYCSAAQNFLEEIRVRLDVTYESDNSTTTTYKDKFKKIRETFESFGFWIGYNGIWDYLRDQNFWRVYESIYNKQPVFIAGYKNDLGHIWVLDGYKKIVIRSYYADYYFDEYGKFNAEKRYFTETTQQEYVHANLGWGKGDLVWVNRGSYDFGGTNYDSYLYYLAGIYPRI